MTTRIYIAGPMSGIPHFNFPEFFKAEAMLHNTRPGDVEVLNPAAEDNRFHDADISQGNLFGDVQQAEAEHSFDRRRALAGDVHYIAGFATEIYMLAGWSKSRGAIAERAVAQAVGITVTYEQNWETDTQNEEDHYWRGREEALNEDQWATSWEEGYVDSPH